jgi:hypothetical protein
MVVAPKVERNPNTGRFRPVTPLTFARLITTKRERTQALTVRLHDRAEEIPVTRYTRPFGPLTRAQAAVRNGYHGPLTRREAAEAFSRANRES